jgi:hypothetical protein
MPEYKKMIVSRMCFSGPECEGDISLFRQILSKYQTGGLACRVKSPPEVDGKISELVRVQTFKHGGGAILVKRNAEVSDAGHGAKV